MTLRSQSKYYTSLISEKGKTIKLSNNNFELNSKLLFKTTTLPPLYINNKNNNNKKNDTKKEIFQTTKEVISNDNDNLKENIKLFRINTKRSYCLHFNKKRQRERYYILKKIKLRFFTNYCKKYIVLFLNELSKTQNNIIPEHLEYKKFYYNFIKKVYPRKNNEWNIKEKSILEIYHEFSPLKIPKLINILKKDKDLFVKTFMKTLSNKAKFVLLESLEKVFSVFAQNKTEVNKLVNELKMDSNTLKSFDNYECLIKNFIMIVLHQKQEQISKNEELDI